MRSASLPWDAFLESMSCAVMRQNCLEKEICLLQKTGRFFIFNVFLIIFGKRVDKSQKEWYDITVVSPL
jgi:hypothetical protein